MKLVTYLNVGGVVVCSLAAKCAAKTSFDEFVPLPSFRKATTTAPTPYPTPAPPSPYPTPKLTYETPTPYIPPTESKPSGYPIPSLKPTPYPTPPYPTPTPTPESHESDEDRENKVKAVADAIVSLVHQKSEAESHDHTDDDDISKMFPKSKITNVTPTDSDALAEKEMKTVNKYLDIVKHSPQKVYDTPISDDPQLPGDMGGAPVTVDNNSVWNKLSNFFGSIDLAPQGETLHGYYGR